MPKVLSIRDETPEEQKIREWFDAQVSESPNNIEEAARLLIGLVTGLLGVLFGVLTISAETLPVYLSAPIVKITGVAAVILWLISLLAGLFVILPRRWEVGVSKPVLQTEIFSQLLRYKSRWMTISVFTFGLAIIALGIVLVFAVLSV